MVRSISVLALIIGLITSSTSWSVDQGKLKGFDTGENPFAPIIQSPRVAKVRIPLKLTHFEEIIIQNQYGAKRLEYKPLKPVQYNLKATINRSNHFYLDDWHIETVPMVWQRESSQWQVDLKFYKRYGEEQDLEEYVGLMSLSGRLIGNQEIMSLDAKGMQKFQNKRGSPLLLVEAGKIVNEDKGQVAKREP